VVATVPTSAPATQRLLARQAGAIGKEIAVTTAINPDAFARLQAGDVSGHDDLVRREIDRLAPSVDVIALGQISLAQLRHTASVPILQVGQSGFAEARRLLTAASAA